jgi:hypothetical protein
LIDVSNVVCRLIMFFASWERSRVFAINDSSTRRRKLTTSLWKERFLSNLIQINDIWQRIKQADYLQCECTSFNCIISSW